MRQTQYAGFIELKRSQLKIQEMAFMLLGVILFFIIVALFVLSITYTNLKKDADRIRQTRTISAISSIADSPEFACSVSKSSCVDLDKAISLANKPVYRNYYSFQSLRILLSRGLNKDQNQLVRCSFANYPECDIIIIYEDQDNKGEILDSSFAALCRKELENSYVYDKCEIGKIIAGTRKVAYDEQ